MQNTLVLPKMYKSQNIIKMYYYKLFAVRQICEKYIANWKDVFWPVMDLENAYDTLRQLLRVYGVG